MNILILGSISLPIPPKFSGGTERIAYEQAVGFSRAGHEVLLVGGGGSKDIKRPSDPATKEIKDVEVLEVGGSAMDYQYDPKTMEGSRKLRLENALLAEVGGLLLNRRHDYDWVINNLRAGEAVLLPLLKLLKKPLINVLHLPLFDELVKVFQQYRAPLISISNNQRGRWQNLNWLGTVYNGVDVKRFRPAVTVTKPVSSIGYGKVKNTSPLNATDTGFATATPNRYLLNISTIGWHKGQAIAVETARRTGLNLILAGKIRDRDYFEKFIQPAVDDGIVKLMGEMGMAEKLKLYQGALAFLFPIQWNEPFGLVMIEAMACGAPVIAFDRGSVPEVVKDGKTGYIINDKYTNQCQMSNVKCQISKTGIDGMVEAVNKFKVQSSKFKVEMRRQCRKWVEEKFTVEKMVKGYERIYEKLSN